MGVVEHKDRSLTGYFAWSDGDYSWHGDCAVPSDNDGYGVAKTANGRRRSEKKFELKQHVLAIQNCVEQTIN